MKMNKIAFFVTILLTFSLSVIFLKEHSPAETTSEKNRGTTVRGRVISVYGPVQNARVRVAGEEEYTLTDRDGRFNLQTDHPPGTRLRVTAGKKGWFNNGQRSDPTGRIPDIFLNPLYLNDQPDYKFIAPAVCAQCHTKLSKYYNRSKMAHTSSNPKVLDMFYGTDALGREGVAPGYRIDNPDKNGECTFCHAPSAAASSRKTPDLKTALKSPGTEGDGISCDFCHKVRKVVRDKTKPSGVAPVFERQASKRGPSILVFGPYDDVVVPPMAASYNPIFETGEFCSICHSHFRKMSNAGTWDPRMVYSDSERDGLGLKDDNLLPIQTTFQEWKQWQDQLPSDDPNKGKKCQDCHMSWRKEMLPYDNHVVDGMARSRWGTRRSPGNIRPHHFEGGTATQLKTALAMELEGEVKNKRLDIDVYITNTNGGHWVPTGEPMRSVMLTLRAIDSDGNPLRMTKGSRLPDWTGVEGPEKGGYAGLPGAVFAKVLQDNEGNIHVPFWRATSIASDTRIRPKDTVELKFAFELNDPDDEPTVEARLLYRPVIRSLAKKKNWPVEDILITSVVW